MTRRMLTFVSASIATFFVLACKPAPPPVSPPDPPSIAEVVEWLVGEQLRGPKTSNRGTNVGIVTLSLVNGSLSPNTLAPGSCAPELVSFIPIPGAGGEYLAVDAAGQLFRYAGGQWSAVQSKVKLSPIAKLLGFQIPTDPSRAARELLVYEKNDSAKLWLLTLVDGVVVGRSTVDLATFTKRAAALERFDSRRCIDRTRNCLHLTTIGNGVVLSREPTIHANWESLAELGNTGARDVRYLGDEGEEVSVLIAAPCAPPDLAPAATNPPSATAPTESSASQLPGQAAE